MRNVLVSVIIPHLNQASLLCRCLTALDGQTIDRAAFEVLVVDNGSRELPMAEIGRFQGVRLLREAAAGPGPARNHGVKESKGEILAFTDSDCIPHPDWLKTGVEELTSAPAGTVLGGDIRILAQDPAHYTSIEAYESIFGFLQQKYVESAGFSVTANLMLRRTDFDRSGPFAGIEVAEDMDFGVRARRAGCTFRYVAGMIVFHPARKSFRDLCVKWDRHLDHFVTMAQVKPLWKICWAARAFAVFWSPLIHIFKVFSSDRVRGMNVRLKALPVLIGLRSYRAWRMLVLLWSRKPVAWNST